MTKLHLDFETASVADLKIVGLDNYAKASSTRPLMLGWAFDEDPPELWFPHLGPMPAEVQKALESDVVLVAWNSTFERAIFHYPLKTIIPASRFLDPMVYARHLSLPGHLADAGMAIGLPHDLAKQTDGKRLIKKFSMPYHKGGEETLFGISEPQFHNWEDEPRDWALFGEYCFTPEHTLLGEDLLWKSASDFQVGDVVLGFDEEGPRRKFRGAVIEVISYDAAPVFEVLLVSGKIFRVTREHKWLTCRKRTKGSENSSQRLRWLRTDGLESQTKNHGNGWSSIPRLISPWKPDYSYETGWLAGILDGEGSYCNNHLTVGQNPGTVQNRIRTNLSQYAELSSRPTNGDGRKCETIHVKGHKLATLKVLGQVRPARLLEKVNFDTLGQLECRDIRDGVVSITPIGTQRIIKIQTSTGTLVVDGYPMHNCKQDVIAERAILKLVSNIPLPESEQRAWILDQKINDRGIPVNRKFVQNALALSLESKKRLTTKLKEITQLVNPNSRDQFLGWAQKQQYPHMSLGKNFVKAALAPDSGITALCRQALQLRQEASKTSYTKFETLLNMMSSDDRLRHAFLFMGASRTGRWSGKGSHGGSVQVQNLSRPDKIVEANYAAALALIEEGDYEKTAATILTWYPLDKKPDIPPVIGMCISCVRSAFQVAA